MRRCTDRLELEIGSRVEKYRIVSKLGEGGSGIVYAAHDVDLDEPAALKIIPLTNATVDLADRARHEAKVLRRLRQENLVFVYDAGVSSVAGYPFVYLVMERLHGFTLRRVLSTVGMLSVPEVLAIGWGVAAGIAFVHGAGIYHRDLKPENIFILAGNRVKVIDFGIAKISRHGFKTQGNIRPGTPFYLSPEQITGERVDARCDIYALGLVIFEALAGHHFIQHGGNKAPTHNEIIASHLGAEVPELSAEYWHIRRELSEAVGHMLAKFPEHRYASMEKVKSVFGFLAETNAAWAASRQVEGLATMWRELCPIVASHPKTGTDALAFTTEVSSMPFSSVKPAGRAPLERGRYTERGTLRMTPVDQQVPPITPPLQPRKVVLAAPVFDSRRELPPRSTGPHTLPTHPLAPRRPKVIEIRPPERRLPPPPRSPSREEISSGFGVLLAPRGLVFLVGALICGISLAVVTWVFVSELRAAPELVVTTAAPSSIAQQSPSAVALSPSQPLPPPWPTPQVVPAPSSSVPSVNRGCPAPAGCQMARPARRAITPEPKPTASALRAIY